MQNDLNCNKTITYLLVIFIRFAEFVFLGDEIVLLVSSGLKLKLKEKSGHCKKHLS